MKPELKIDQKILAYKSPQRYAVRKAVVAASEELRSQIPGLQVEVEDIKKLEQIESFTPVTIYPSLMVNGKLVCVGRFPHKDEIIAWLQQALD
jgi:hypothetical protein